jgi:hypothetical protein
MQAATEIANLTKSRIPQRFFSSLTKNPTSNYALVSKSVDLATKRAIEKLNPGHHLQDCIPAHLSEWRCRQATSQAT